MMNDKYYIKNEGMGGFLNPPLHAEHSYSVESYNRDTSMSLSYALTCDYIPSNIQEKARSLLKKYLIW